MMNHARNGLVRVLLLLLFAAVVIHGERTAMSDEESEALLKFKDLIDTSVDQALEYLATQQAENGSFPGQYGHFLEFGFLTELGETMDDRSRT